MMMYNNFMGYSGFGLWHGMGGLFGLAFLIGIILLIAWATKNLKKEKILNWGIALIAISIIGWLIMMLFGGLMFRFF